VKAKLAAWRRDPVAFIGDVLVNPETGKAFELFPIQERFLRELFSLAPDGRLKYPEAVYGCPKKSGKSTTAAMAMLYAVIALGGQFAEGIILANDESQATDRIFTAAARIVEASPMLRDSAKITAGRIEFRSTGATISAISSDFASAAGSNPVFICADEIWAFATERSARLLDEVIPSPARKISGRLIVSYAGFSGESTVLERLHQQGVKGEQIAPALYVQPGLLMLWSHEPIAPWQDLTWIEAMRRMLRPSAFQRLVLNQWASAESAFLEAEMVDACTDENLRPVIGGDSGLPIFVGVDAASKHDMAAVVAVSFDDETRKVKLIRHYLWAPTPDNPLDFSRTIEAALIELRNHFWLMGVYFDPWQLTYLSQRASDLGIPMEPYNQTSGNLTEMGQGLYSLFRDKNITIYPNLDVRKSLLNAAAIESPRGFRIGKQTASRKIDLTVALAMACIAAMRHERQGFGVFQYYRERAARAAQGLPEPIDTELQDIYEAERWKIEGDANCHKCGLPMGVAKTLNTDGKYYHPECARGW
jgi:phage terminase large subunit-like protein